VDLRHRYSRQRSLFDDAYRRSIGSKAPVTKRDGLKPQRLLWGVPPLADFEEHQGLHGLAFGPEGDLYVSFGDNLIFYGDFKRADHWGYWTFFHGQSKRHLPVLVA